MTESMFVNSIHDNNKNIKNKMNNNNISNNNSRYNISKISNNNSRYNSDDKDKDESIIS